MSISTAFSSALVEEYVSPVVDAADVYFVAPAHVTEDDDDENSGGFAGGSANAAAGMSCAESNAAAVTPAKTFVNRFFCISSIPSNELLRRLKEYGPMLN